MKRVQQDDHGTGHEHDKQLTVGRLRNDFLQNETKGRRGNENEGLVDKIGCQIVGIHQSEGRIVWIDIFCGS